MATLITDSELENRLREQRRACGGDRYDEVWEGVYLMAPMPNNEHQLLVTEMTFVFRSVIEKGVFPGCNISDHKDDWTKNYRVPDVAIFLGNNPAENCGDFWFGGPDFAVEITGKDDKTRDKIEFYAEVNTRELMIVDRDPWRLELLRLDNNHLRTVEEATVDNKNKITSEVVPFSFELIEGDERPLVRVTATASEQSWEF